MKAILFLCVANSARSQMAEGIARSLLPACIEVFSAGSRPTHVRSEAIRVLDEIGIDISACRSKSISEIPFERIDTVVTLCAEEACPFFATDVRRFHWALTDPAVANGKESDRLVAFRKTRDELICLIRSLIDTNDPGQDHRKDRP